MSNENIVCSHELVVRLDQLEDGTVNWLVQPSEAIANTSHASFDEMVDAGAPLSAKGAGYNLYIKVSGPLFNLPGCSRRMMQAESYQQSYALIFMSTQVFYILESRTQNAYDSQTTRYLGVAQTAHTQKAVVELCVAWGAT